MGILLQTVFVKLICVPWANPSIWHITEGRVQIENEQMNGCMLVDTAGWCLVLNIKRGCVLLCRLCPLVLAQRHGHECGFSCRHGQEC